VGYWVKGMWCGAFKAAAPMWSPDQCVDGEFNGVPAVSNSSPSLPWVAALL